MCLILFAVNPDENYRLIVAANRDELYDRPTSDAAYWRDSPDVLAGRDENAGGTWLGVNRRGRFAAVTNFREVPAEPLPPRSRGDLPTGFLADNTAASDYLSAVSQNGQQYKGFNLLIADAEQCCYYSNRGGEPRQLDNGYYGLSNQLLDCDWPKVIDGRQKLRQTMTDFGGQGSQALSTRLIDLLVDQGDEREFSNSFISSEQYGTRAATVVIVTHDGLVYFEERNFGVGGKPLATNAYDFSVK